MFQRPRVVSPSLAAHAEARPAREAGATAAPLGMLGVDLSFLWRRRKWIVAAIAASLVMGLIADLTMTPRYRAVSQILIGPVDLRVVEKTVQPTAQTADANVIQVESEVRVLTSDKVLRRAVESERLTELPEYRPRGVSMTAALMSTLRAATGLEVEAPKPVDAELAALRQLQRNVMAKRGERTYVVDLIVDSTDPERSARIANAIAQAYLDEQSASRTEAARRASGSLSARLGELRERVRRAEEQVERYKADNNIVGATGRLIDEQQLTDSNVQMTAAKARTAEAKARLDQVLRLQRSGADPGAITEAVQSSTIGRLREQYATAARQEATLAAELGPRHPWVIDAAAQARNAQRQIADEVRRIVEATRSDYERALANENALIAGLDVLKRRAKDTSLAFVKLRELEREADASRAVYESFLVRARETQEQERLDTANVRILSDAQPPQDRAWPPRRLIVLMAALILGIIGGVGSAYCFEVVGDRSRRDAHAARARERLA